METVGTCHGPKKVSRLQRANAYKYCVLQRLTPHKAILRMEEDGIPLDERPHRRAVQNSTQKRAAVIVGQQDLFFDVRWELAPFCGAGPGGNHLVPRTNRY